MSQSKTNYFRHLNELLQTALNKSPLAGHKLDNVDIEKEDILTIDIRQALSNKSDTP